MSQETIEDLNQNVLIGYTDKRGTAWWYRKSEAGDEPNHYDQAIPIDDVRRRLFNWHAIEGRITATHTPEPLITVDGVTQEDPIVSGSDEFKAIMRSDTGAILGIPKKGYTIHQYDEWLVHNVERLLDADLMIGSAGLLRNGAQAWVQIEMEETLGVTVGGSEIQFRPHLTAATSLDSSLATTYRRSVQVVVCDNTLSAALADGSGTVRIKHSTNSMARIGEARDALGIVYSTADDFIAQVEKLGNQVVTDAQWAEFVKAYSAPTTANPSQRSKSLAATKTEGLMRLWRTDQRVAPWAGSAYGVLAAVNTFEHHEGNIKGGDRAGRNMSRAITGGWDKTDADTLALLEQVLTSV